ncbi:substrate-binding periplasmic protein [Pseudomarimonas salicorniae]|uniref:Transporter substrate-binding domain-containing protein n=1 Tax=Pseudomarimonas salicorniae TaxID=2933270 RepID=A0ABT0GL25_9GAMM|nr:transporter substrate-binding domain-containing protein [Lysobacter sp. CAU 1642]MCK7595250.1 transporter substrate-binding domain-containing protein [Lysobacter sp. CAU 1642]
MLLVAVPLQACPASPAPLRLLLGTAAPWTYFDQDCQPAGIGIDVLRALSRESGVRVEFVYVDYESERPALLDGRLEGDINEINPWYEKHLVRIAPVLALEEVVIGRIQGAADDAAPTQRIGHVITHNSRRSALAGLEAKIVEFDDYQSLIRAYLDGELDAVAGIKETLLFHLYRLGAGPEVLSTLRSLQTVAVWLYLSPRVDAERRERLEQVLLASNLDPVLRQARTMHLSAHSLRAPRDPEHCADPPRSAPD